MENLSEDDFKKRALELFEELEQRTKRLIDFEPFTKEVIKLINEAKSLFAENKITESLIKYNEVFEKLEKAEISIRGEPLAWRLLWLEIAYLILLLFLAYFTYQWPDFKLWKGLVNLHAQTAWFGALGGVTIAVYGIYNHVQLRDFDPKYQLWYICKPIIGGIFGWFAFLIYYIGLISVQDLQDANKFKMKTPELPFIISFLAGFSERFTIKIIDRLMAVLTTWEEKGGATTQKTQK